METGRSKAFPEFSPFTIRLASRLIGGRIGHKLCAMRIRQRRISDACRIVATIGCPDRDITACDAMIAGHLIFLSGFGLIAF